MLSTLYDAISPTAVVITSISLMLFLGFAMTRVTKKLKLPNVTAYILVGVLISPYCFDLVPPGIIEGMDFLSDIALAFIAFGTGEFFRVSILRRNGPRVILVSLIESAVTALSIFVLMFFVLRTGLAIAIVLSGKWKLGQFKYVRICCDLVCVVLGVGLFLLAGGTIAQVPTIAGVGTIITAFFMGPLIQFFNDRVAIPLLEKAR